MGQRHARNRSHTRGRKQRRAKSFEFISEINLTPLNDFEQALFKKIEPDFIAENRKRWSIIVSGIGDKKEKNKDGKPDFTNPEPLDNIEIEYDEIYYTLQNEFHLELDNDMDKYIANCMITNLKSNGFLDKQLFDDILFQLKVEEDRTEAVRQKLMRFEVLEGRYGIGCYDEREYLLLYLENKDYPNPLIYHIADELLCKYREDFTKQNYNKIAENEKIKEIQLKNALKWIALNIPAPLQINKSIMVPVAKQRLNSKNDKSMPDIMIEIVEDHGRRQLVPFINGSERYLGVFKDIAEKHSYEEIKFLEKEKKLTKKQKENIRKNALKRIIEIYNSRLNSMHVLINIIISKQRKYLLGLSEYPEPLPVKEVAARIKMPRASLDKKINGKEIITPRGVLVIRDLLPVDDQPGIWFNIFKIIEEFESKNISISDKQISDILKKRNIVGMNTQNRGKGIARKTVEKYRKLMRIPNSHIRKKQKDYKKDNQLPSYKDFYNYYKTILNNIKESKLKKNKAKREKQGNTKRKSS